MRARNRTGALRFARPLPLRKTHGTAYNLDPDTERVPVHTVQAGDVVMEGPGHPVRIERRSRPGHGRYRIWVEYIWRPAWEIAWPLGDYDGTHHLDRALPREYPTA